MVAELDYKPHPNLTSPGVIVQLVGQDRPPLVIRRIEIVNGTIIAGDPIFEVHVPLGEGREISYSVDDVQEARRIADATRAASHLPRIQVDDLVSSRHATPLRVPTLTKI